MVINQDSYGGGVDHKLDYMIGNRESGQLVHMAQMPGDQLGTLKVPVTADLSWEIARKGMIYVAADGDQNDRVTGQTSFANTLATFVLHNPANSGVLCLPFFYQLSQTGSVAGGDIAVETEIVSPSAFSSGTLEKTRKLRIGYGGGLGNKCLLYSTVTTTAGYGIAIGHATLGPDVSPAEGVINVYEWQAPVGLILDPNTSLNVFTSAASTGPTWGWHFTWAEIPQDWLD